MQEALIPFGKQLDTGLVVSVDEVPRGQACNCTCLFCNEPLVAKKGNEKQHYFAHKSRTSNEEQHCEASFPRSVFWMVRRIITESDAMRLPRYILKLDDYFNGLKKEYTVTSESTIQYSEPIFPNELEDYDADVAIVSIKGIQLAICIYLETCYLSRSLLVGDNTIACVSIDLSGLRNEFRKRRFQFREILEQYILHGIDKKTWEYHPREVKYRNEHARLARSMDMHRYSNRPSVKKKKPLPINKSPNLGVPVRAEAQETRIAQLIDWARELQKAGVSEAWLCGKCKVLRVPGHNKCKYCNSNEIEPIVLSPQYFDHIEQKYRCWNYGITSASNLKVWPNPQLKIEDNR